MADVKISQLPAATTPVAGTEVLPIVQSGTTSQVSINAATGITRPFTANGVMYASSATALATGSALTFDGTNFLTTGSATGTAFIPSGSTVPTNGMYLPTTNSVAWSTNTTERMRIDSSGKVGINVTPAAGTDAKLQLTGLATNATTLATAYSAASLVVVPKSTSGFSLAIASGTGDAPQLQVSANGAAAGDLLIQPYGGNVGIGTSSPGGTLHLVAASANFLMNQYSADGVGPAAALAKSRGTTGSPSAVLTGDSLAIFSGGGYNASSIVYNKVAIQMYAAENWTTTANGSYMTFATTATGATGRTESMRIDSLGNVGIGTSSPSASAILDAQSTTKGVRMPNMTTTQKNAISSPAAGLMVFDTTLSKLAVYSGSAWQTVTSV